MVGVSKPANREAALNLLRMIPFRRLATGLFALFAMMDGPPALSQGATTSSAVELNRMADDLKPGQWVWAPQIAPQGPMLVYVDLSRQEATVYRNGVRIAVSTVSTGKPGHETPTGVFTILQKDQNHRSSLYNSAPMPWQERLTWDGVALHAGGLPGYPESHGCVHLPMEFAKLLFGETQLGGTVIVAGAAGKPDMVSPAGVLATEAPGGAAIAHRPLAPDEQYRWQPELSPAGPVSILLSVADQRAVVLRNGIEIGRARISLPATDTSTRVYTLAPAADGKQHWVRVGLPGAAQAAGVPLATDQLATLNAPQAFLTDVQPLLVPGVHVLVTAASILPASSGGRLTVLASQE